MPKDTKSHEVIIALSKARAAAALLDICAHGSKYLQMPSGLTEQEAHDTRGWIKVIAHEVLTAALEEVERAPLADNGSATREAARVKAWDLWLDCSMP